MIGISFGSTDLVPAAVTFCFAANAVCLLLLYLTPVNDRPVQSSMSIA